MSDKNTGDNQEPDAGAQDDATPADQTGDSGDADLTPGDIPAEVVTQIRDQVKNEVWAEAREALNDKDERIQNLEVELQEVKDSSPNADGDDNDQNLYTEDQVEEKLQELRDELEDQKSTFERVNQTFKHNRLTEELRERGVVKAEMFAGVLAEQVEADAASGEFTIKTEEGNPAVKLGEDYELEQMSLDDFVGKWVEQNPEFVEDSTQGGSGFDRSGEGPANMEQRIAAAEAEGDLDTARSGKVAQMWDQGNNAPMQE